MLDLENAACVDLAAIEERDPACDSYLTAFLFFKGYKSLQIYRVSHILWMAGRKELASLMQSRSSEVFAVDIHPAARIGPGLMIDHATGLVIGETAVVGNNCSFLHGVTLGGTGKEWGDRHPKVGNNVSIGCNASILGNISIGDDCKVGCNSVVVKDVPAGATAVGSPARILTGRLSTEASSSLLKLSPVPPQLEVHQAPRLELLLEPGTPLKRSVSFDVESNCPCCKISCRRWDGILLLQGTVSLVLIIGFVGLLCLLSCCMSGSVNLLR
jgi:serine O-acetyltransferase